MEVDNSRQGPEQPLNLRVEPQWSVQPQEHEHALKGRVPFDMLFLPERPGAMPLADVHFDADGAARDTSDPRIEALIAERIRTEQEKTTLFNQALSEQLRSQGVPEEEITPQLRQFFDGELARLHPEDIHFGDGILRLRFGKPVILRTLEHAGAWSLKS